MRRKSQSPSQSKVLVIEKKGRSESRGPKNKDRSKNKSNRFANVECYHYGQKKHIKKYYRQIKRDCKNEKGKEKKTDDSNDIDRVSAITDDFLVMSKKCSSLYFMQAKVSDCIINKMENESTTELWRRRLGHMSEKGKQNKVAFKTSPPSRKPDQTIQNIEKTDKTVSQYHDDLMDLDPIPLAHMPVQVKDKVQDDQDGTIDVDTYTQV
ncbi:hypothetical protein QYF36_005524 [Acer negundo]|nr:hypothetical protein QYF36_005524 [Acer negundo]